MKREHHDEDARRRTGRVPANRLALDYRAAPRRRIDARIVDVHTHVYRVESARAFFDAAAVYGIGKVVSMTPLDEVDTLRDDSPLPIEFIAIPRWRQMKRTAEFRSQWLADLAAFREKGARFMKFWMAPPMRGQFGLSLEDPFFEPLIRAGIDLDYHFMVHVGDPSAWFEKNGRYADAATFGTKRDQYPQLEYLLERVAPRTVIGAHMGGSVEDPAFLQTLLDRNPNYMLDTSATKWIAREVARRPEALRDFIIRNVDRILFGSDLVVSDGCDFDHYASRYWVHQRMWESEYRGESPIEDPDADDPPRVAGLDLPDGVLQKLYHANAHRLGF